MNKARRMISLQARALAAAGHRVLIPDLYGTGDSDGDFADASWETWIQDLTLLRRWLQERDGVTPSFWSLRTGALLGAGLITAEAPPQWLLWQPVVNGQQFLTQFLRLKVAAEMTGTGPPVDTRALRADLSAGSSVEIAGYELPGPLAVALDSKSLSAATLSRVPRVGWFEVTTSTTPSLSPVAKKVIDECRAQGASTEAQVIDAQVIQGQPFWSTPEITLAPELLAASSKFAAGSRFVS
jgi:exosortase A-associated hydrolase 2